MSVSPYELKIYKINIFNNLRADYTPLGRKRIPYKKSIFQVFALNIFYFILTKFRKDIQRFHFIYILLNSAPTSLLILYFSSTRAKLDSQLVVLFYFKENSNRSFLTPYSYFTCKNDESLLETRVIKVYSKDLGTKLEFTTGNFVKINPDNIYYITTVY